MTTTPTGLPAWTRTASPETYGGIATLRDQGGIGKVNAKTDVSAAEWLRMSADLAHAVATIPLFWAKITVAFSTNVSVTSATVQPQWGAAETYSTTPPSDYYPTFSSDSPILSITFPNCTATDGGIYWVTIPDEYGVDGRFQMSSFELPGPFAGALSNNGTTLAIDSVFFTGDVIHLVVY